jgi:DNA/RNA-binding domain of Phe-tRNA-synthetase-like protein
MPLLTIDPALAGKVQLAVFQAAELTAAGPCPALEQDLAALLARLRTTYAKPAEAAELFGPARALYRALGLDPTKNRPSSEALIRRIIRGRDLYRINRIVDACNLCSIDFALPIGLYDTAAVRWPACLRRGREGEGYRGLGKDHVNVAGRYAFADQEGPFGNPSSDSFRTRIRDDSTECTFAIFAPADYPPARLAQHLAAAMERMVRYSGGQVLRDEVIQTP